MSLRISASALVPPGRWILMRDGRPVATVARGAPIEDAEIDELIVPEADFADIRRLIPLVRFSGRR